MTKSTTLRTENSYFSFLPELGCQWTELVLPIPDQKQGEKSISVIQGYKQGGDFFSSGNFCMFPWVNRMWPNSFIEQNELKLAASSKNSHLVLDGNGFPLHGSISNSPWRRTNSSNSYSLDYKDPVQLRKCQLEQSFELRDSSLIVETKILNQEPNNWDYSLGYHPYFQLPHGKVDDWILEFHGRVKNIPLDQNCFPILENFGQIETLPYVNVKTVALKFLSLDHLYYFPEGLSISLYHPEHPYALNIESFSSNTNNLFPFCQIYTPSNRESIAIEPMLTPGNFEKVYFKYTERKFRKNHFFFQISLQLRSIK